MILLKSDEIELKGNWILLKSSIEVDDVTKRIEKLATEYLIEIAVDESGWEKLFQDPVDKRYWELIYPSSEMHGGGPPLLRCISQLDAKTKYPGLQ